MRTFKSLMISLCMGTTLCMCLPQTTTAQTVSSGDSWTWDKGTFVIDTPELTVCAVVVCGKHMHRVVPIHKLIINDLKVLILFEFKD